METTTRKQQLFAAKKPAVDVSIVPTTVKYVMDKNKHLTALSQDAKMICALRKVLVTMSDENKVGQRYFVASPTCQVISRSSSPGIKSGEPGIYSARGRIKIGLTGPDGVSYKNIEFTINFRDVKDRMGLADVEYVDPTTIDELPSGTKLPF